MLVGEPGPTLKTTLGHLSDGGTILHVIYHFHFRYTLLQTNTILHQAVLQPFSLNIDLQFDFPGKVKTLKPKLTIISNYHIVSWTYLINAGGTVSALCVVVKCLCTVYDAGTTLIQHWDNDLYFLGWVFIQTLVVGICETATSGEKNIFQIT